MLRGHWEIKNFALLTFIEHLEFSVINYVMNVMDFNLIALDGVLLVSCSCYYLFSGVLSIVAIKIIAVAVDRYPRRIADSELRPL